MYTQYTSCTLCIVHCTLGETVLVILLVPSIEKCQLTRNNSTQILKAKQYLKKIQIYIENYEKKLNYRYMKRKIVYNTNFPFSICSK